MFSIEIQMNSGPGFYPYQLLGKDTRYVLVYSSRYRQTEMPLFRSSVNQGTCKNFQHGDFSNAQAWASKFQVLGSIVTALLIVEFFAWKRSKYQEIYPKAGFFSRPTIPNNVPSSLVILEYSSRRQAIDSYIPKHRKESPS